MKLRNKRTSDIWEFDGISMTISVSTKEKLGARGCSGLCYARSLSELNEEWEDYEPANPIFDDEKVSKAIRAWLSIQVQPIETVSILCHKDSDGFFSYSLYGYIAKARIVDGKAVENKNLLAISFDFRSDTYFEHDRRHDYTIAELCGEEEE